MPIVYPTSAINETRGRRRLGIHRLDKHACLCLCRLQSRPRAIDSPLKQILVTLGECHKRPEPPQNRLGGLGGGLARSSRTMRFASVSTSASTESATMARAPPSSIIGMLYSRLPPPLRSTNLAMSPTRSRCAGSPIARTPWPSDVPSSVVSDCRRIASAPSSVGVEYGSMDLDLPCDDREYRPIPFARNHRASHDGAPAPASPGASSSRLGTRMPTKASASCARP